MVATSTYIINFISVSLDQLFIFTERVGTIHIIHMHVSFSVYSLMEVYIHVRSHARTSLCHRFQELVDLVLGSVELQ